MAPSPGGTVTIYLHSGLKLRTLIILSVVYRKTLSLSHYNIKYLDGSKLRIQNKVERKDRA
jgi:hypothetical protein